MSFIEIILLGVFVVFTLASFALLTTIADETNVENKKNKEKQNTSRTRNYK